jgi:hypothetical protein
VGSHHFARLPLAFFSLITVLSAVGVVLDRIRRADWSPARATVIQALIAAALAVPVSAGERQFRTDHFVQSSRHALVRISSDPKLAAALDQCNAFHFRLDERFYNPDDRIGQFFFGRRVVERVRRGDPIRTCVVDLVHATVLGPS